MIYRIIGYLQNNPVYNIYNAFPVSSTNISNGVQYRRTKTELNYDPLSQNTSMLFGPTSHQATKIISRKWMSDSWDFMIRHTITVIHVDCVFPCTFLLPTINSLRYALRTEFFRCQLFQSHNHSDKADQSTRPKDPAE